MTIIIEDSLTFSFPAGSFTLKYDETSFYRNQFIKISNNIKAVDIIHIDGPKLWLIEIKDYRIHRRAKSIDLIDEISGKICDTLAGLVAARNNANEAVEKQFAQEALARTQICIVLHLEENGVNKKISPQKTLKMGLEQKMKQKLKCIDFHPRVVNQYSLRQDMNWTVTG